MSARPEFYRVNSDFFVWTGHVGVCDVTDLPPEMPMSQRFTDAFDVVSSKTGKVVTFQFYQYITNADGEIVGWEYLAPNKPHIVRILND